MDIKMGLKEKEWKAGRH